MNSNLSVLECLRYGWSSFKQRPWFLVGVVLLAGVINVLIPTPEDGQAIPLMVGLFIVSMLLGALLQLGIVNFSLHAHDNIMTVRLKDLWRPDLYLRFLGASIAVFIMVGVPLLALWGVAVSLFVFVSWVAFAVVAIPLLIATIIVGLSLYFFTYVVVDKQAGPITAIKESFRITKGFRWKLFQLLLMSGLVNLLGLVCLIVGLFVSIPVTILASVHAYRTLERARSALPVPASPDPLPAIV